MPKKTLNAIADDGRTTGDTITAHYADVATILAALDQIGVSYADVVALLEVEGVDKFARSWDELLTDVSEKLDKERGVQLS
jgi:transaldolase